MEVPLIRPRESVVRARKGGHPGLSTVLVRGICLFNQPKLQLGIKSTKQICFEGSGFRMRAAFREKSAKKKKKERKKRRKQTKLESYSLRLSLETSNKEV